MGTPSAGAAQGSRPGNRPTVLVIDDDARVRELSAATLETEYDVVLAEDGQKGLRALYERRPDVVLLDVRMPGLCGYEVCRRIREVSDVAILMVSAHGEDADVIRGVDVGADDYRGKTHRAIQ